MHPLHGSARLLNQSVGSPPVANQAAGGGVALSIGLGLPAEAATLGIEGGILAK